MQVVADALPPYKGPDPVRTITLQAGRNVYRVHVTVYADGSMNWIEFVSRNGGRFRTIGRPQFASERYRVGCALVDYLKSA